MRLPHKDDNGLWPWQDTKSADYRAKYKIYMVSPLWQFKKILCRIESGRKCVACENKSRLTIHHINYSRMFHEEQDDLICLCWKHHKKVENWSKTICPRPNRQEIFNFLNCKDETFPIGNRDFEILGGLLTEWEEAESNGYFHPYHTHF